MDIIKFRNTIISNLNKYIRRPVIFIPSENPIPEYPFVTYAIINSYIADDTGYLKGDYSVDRWIIEEKVQQVQFVISFNAYGKDSFENKQLIKKCRDYFTHVGTFDLKREGIVLVSTSDIENRDLLDVDELERKEGFDITFRLVDRVQRKTETIENYEIGEIK